MTAPEWGFDVLPEQVDIDRLWTELHGSRQPAIRQYAYLAELRAKAPVTYERLRQKRLAAGCTVFAWPAAMEHSPP